MEMGSFFGAEADAQMAWAVSRGQDFRFDVNLALAVTDAPRQMDRRAV